VLAGCGLLVLALTAGTMPILLRRELAPLDHLAEQTQHIDADSLSARFLTAGLPGELAPITTRLNDLLERLQKAFDRERQFSADLAHELRTPLAELRSLAELALKWPDARDADFDGHVLAIALRMELMVTRLLAIVRSEHGQFSVSCEPVCVSALVSAVCQPLQVKAAARRLAIEVDVPAAFEIHSDPVVLRSIMTNLVENAVEYSSPGGTVRIHSDAQEGRFNLAVTNPVEQLEAADLPNLGDRFWRKDAARSSRDHSGLGLSVVRALAAALGCNLRATLDDSAGLSMTVSGPIKPRNHVVPPISNSGKTEKQTQ